MLPYLSFESPSTQRIFVERLKTFSAESRHLCCPGQEEVGDKMLNNFKTLNKHQSIKNINAKCFYDVLGEVYIRETARIDQK